MKKKITTQNIFVVLLILSIGFLCILAGLRRIYLSDFIPINGDFQSYNGFRRLLDGQIPFKDFYFYLGLGPLYLNSLAIFIMGDNFTNSLFVTNTITALMFSITIFVIFKLNNVSKNISLILAFTILAFGLGFKDFLNFHVFFRNFDLLSYATPGVSLRTQRAFLPFIIALIVLIMNKRKNKVIIKNENIRNIVFGILTGSCIAWSNDYGISVFLTICYIFTLLHFQWDLQFIKKTSLFITGILIGVVTMVSLLTLGNIMNWIDYNFFGVAKDQFWYYMTDKNSKLLVLSDIPRGFELISGFIISIYLSYKIRRANYSLKDVLLLFILLSTLIAGYAYSLSSMKDGQFTPFYMVFYISVFSLIINTIQRKLILNRKTITFTKAFIVMLVLVVLVPNISNAINQLNSKRGVYLKELNGHLSHYGDSLQFLSEYYVTDGDLFSTYSSALDVMAGKFQPSGIDYIIHVLGDQYRKKYLESFHSTDPKYVTTIREDFSYWEYWVKRENWFFYREFLSNYEPVAVTEYNVLWEKTDKDLTINAVAKETSVKQINNSTWEIKVNTDPSINNAIADISFNYSSDWNKERWKGMGIRRIVNLSDGWVGEGSGGYNIPNEHEGYNIPIRIINGEGTVRLTSYPENMTDLNLSKVVVNKFYRDSVDYGTIMKNMLNDNRLKEVLNKKTVNLSSFTDVNWEKGVNRGNRAILLFDQNLNNLINLSNSKKIEINNEFYSILSVQSSGTEWIHVNLDRAISGKINTFELK